MSPLFHEISLLLCYFVRLKNTIAAAGSAVMNSLEPLNAPDVTYPNNNFPPQYPPPPSSHQPQYQQRPPPPPPAHIGFGQAQRAFAQPPPQTLPQTLPQHSSDNGESLSGKLKSLLGLEEGGIEGLPPAHTQAPPRHYSQGGGASEGFFPSQTPPPPPQSSQDWSNPSFPASSEVTSDPRYGIPPQPQAPPQHQQQLVSADPFEHMSPEPQVFIHEDSIVMVMKPKELAK